MLNIKDPKAHELAQALAKATGESMTRAVIAALTERLERVLQGRRRASAEELVAIGRRCAEGLIGRVVDHAELLYDENGLPR